MSGVELFTIGGTAATATTAATAGTVITLADMAMVAGLLSGVVGGVSDYQTSRANAAALEQQAKTQRMIGFENAKEMARSNIRDEEILKQQQRKARGARMAAFGQSGLAMTGTPISVMEGAAVAEGLDFAALQSGNIAAEKSVLFGSAMSVQRTRDESRILRQTAPAKLAGRMIGSVGSTIEIGSRIYGGK